MELIHTGLLLVLCFAYTYQLRRSYRDPAQEWAKMAKPIDDEVGPGPRTGGPRRFPPYIIVSGNRVQKELFKPQRGARLVPTSVKEILLAALPPAPPSQPGDQKKTIEMLCHIDRIYVRIRRTVFKNTHAYKHLKLGTCPVNAGNKVHFYLLYYLKSDCGFQNEITADSMNTRIYLNFDPPGPVLREMPFHIPLQCTYPRWFHSYRPGFSPQIRGGTVFKSLTQNIFVLIPQDALGNEITGSKVFPLGEIMYFEARRADNTARSRNERIYINKCIVTASQDPSSNPKVTVIDQQGCMSDSVMTTESQFLPCASKMTQRFSVVAFVFKELLSISQSQQLYMHCDISVGKLEPTESSKACNYEKSTKKWKELYGDDSVCACCATSSCSATPRAFHAGVTSTKPWTVAFEDENVKVDPEVDTEISSFEDLITEDDTDFEHLHYRKID